MSDLCFKIKNNAPLSVMPPMAEPGVEQPYALRTGGEFHRVRDQSFKQIIFGGFDDRFRNAADDASESGTADASWSGSTSSNYSGPPPAHGGTVDEFDLRHTPNDLSLSYDAAPQDTTVASVCTRGVFGQSRRGLYRRRCQ